MYWCRSSPCCTALPRGGANSATGLPTSGACSARTQSDCNGGQLAVAIDIEQFLPIAAPPHLCATVGGNRRFVPGLRERLDVNLRSARLVRLVRNPVSVGRELPEFLIEG